MIVTGVPAAGRSETVNELLEWLDPKYVTVRAFGEDDARDRAIPPMWRYWRALPAFGRIAFYFWGWYGEYMGSALARLAQGQASRASGSSSASGSSRRCSAPMACASSRFIWTSTPTRNASA